MVIRAMLEKDKKILETLIYRESSIVFLRFTTINPIAILPGTKYDK
jgi:hypothetical protein